MGRAAQAVAMLRRENETLRANCDHLSSENASLARQVESMAMRIESLAEELAKPEDVRLLEVVEALDGRAVIFDGLGTRVGHLLDEMDEWIARAGEAERRLRRAEEVVMLARQLTAYAWEDRLDDSKVSDEARHDSRELSIAVWLYDQEALAARQGSMTPTTSIGPTQITNLLGCPLVVRIYEDGSWHRLVGRLRGAYSDGHGNLHLLLEMLSPSTRIEAATGEIAQVRLQNGYLWTLRQFWPDDPTYGHLLQPEVQ